MRCARTALTVINPFDSPLEFTGGDTLVASTDIELLRDRMSVAELAEETADTGNSTREEGRRS